MKILQKMYYFFKQSHSLIIRHILFTLYADFVFTMLSFITNCCKKQPCRQMDNKTVHDWFKHHLSVNSISKPELIFLVKLVNSPLCQPFLNNFQLSLGLTGIEVRLTKINHASELSFFPFTNLQSLQKRHLMVSYILILLQPIIVGVRTQCVPVVTKPQN